MLNNESKAAHVSQLIDIGTALCNSDVINYLLTLQFGFAQSRKLVDKYLRR